MNNCATKSEVFGGSLSKRPYAQREIRYLGWTSQENWVIKLYAIFGRGDDHTRGLTEKATELCRDVLLQAQPSIECHDVAFVITHEGQDGNYVVLDWWVGGNMLSHHIYHAPLTNPLHFRRFQDHDIVSCAWETQVLAFEGRMWIEYILSRGDGADIVAYAEAGLHMKL